MRSADPQYSYYSRPYYNSYPYYTNNYYSQGRGFDSRRSFRRGLATATVVGAAALGGAFIGAGLAHG